MVTEHRHRSVLSKNRGPLLRLSLIISLSLAILALQLNFDYYPPAFSEEKTDDETIYLENPPIMPKKKEVKVEKKKPQPPKLTQKVRVVEEPPKPIESDSFISIEPPVDPPVVIRRKEKPKPKKIATYVEIMPEFPGGEVSLLKYLGKTEYCWQARDNGIEGTVYAQFVINEKGNIQDVKIARGVFPCLDKAVLKRIRKMPTWTPGRQGIHQVKVQMTVPVKFVLD